MNPLKRALATVFSLALWLSTATWASAEVPESPYGEDTAAVQAGTEQRPDPPSRVARLQYTTGAVSIQPAGQGDWVEGGLNRPLTSADNVWTDKDSRAELSTGTALIRMNAETSLTLTSIADQTVQLQLHQGAMNLRVRHLYDGEIYEIDTPNMAFTVQKAGDYRFDVDPNGDASMVTVWKGAGDATGNGPSVHVRAGDQARFVGGTSMVHTIHDAPRPDAFDQWAQVRDHRLDHSVSGRYVSPGVIGSEDLDAYGSWREVPRYGPVWVPTVAPGWAPYHYGHWVWVEPWGWTWVDDAPWGFAPFHYGRWVYYDDYWGWVPGPYYARPVYAPALVAFFGGPHFFIGASFGFGGIGWCPLGFGEPFFPFFGVSRGFFNRVNITNTQIVNITNITNNFFNGHNMPPVRYANMHVRGGFSAVSRDTMINSRHVASNAIPVRGSELRDVHAVNRVPFEHNRNSVLGANAGKPAQAPPSRIAQRPVVSRIGAPAAARGPGQVAALNGGSRELPRGMQNPGTGRIAVPQPPQRGGGVNVANGASTAGNRSLQPDQGRARVSPISGQNGARNVPRPPQAGTITNNRGAGNFPRTAEPPASRPSGRVEVPRPPAGSSRPAMSPRNEGGNAGRGMSPGNVARPQGGGSSSPRSAVPRPTGRVVPAREAGPAGGSAGRFGAPRGESPRPSFSPRPSVSPRGGFEGAPRPSMASRGGGFSEPRSFGGPRSGGGSPQFSAPARSAPQGRMSQPSFGGGGGRVSGGGGGRAPSGGGGGGGGGGRSGGHQSSSGRASGR